MEAYRHIHCFNKGKGGCRLNEKDVRYKADVSMTDTRERDAREPRAQSGQRKDGTVEVWWVSRSGWFQFIEMFRI